MTSYTLNTKDNPQGQSLLFPSKLNNEGQFVGSVPINANVGGSSERGYFYDGTNYVSVNYPGAVGTSPHGLNDAGQIVGSYETDKGDFGFVYNGSTYTTLAAPGAFSTGANDINNAGTVVGGYADSTYHGYIYSNGTYTTVDVPGAKSTSLDGINDKGQAVGNYSPSVGVYAGFIYSNGNIQNLNYPGATSTYLNDISNDGTVVGVASGLPGTNNPAGAVGFTYKNGTFNLVRGTTNITGINDSGQILAQTQDPQTQTTKISISDPANPLCFGSGTLIRTTRGDVPVEALAVGDVAITATGARRPVRWIGRRTLDCAAAPRPSAVWPVRVRAGAFGPGLPARDLRLSPGHPVLVGADADGRGGVLVPIMCLINGTTIERESTATVTYWHVELDAHDLLLAEGLPAESYYDMGSRPWFAGEDGPLIDPDFVPGDAHGRCRPVAVDGPLVEAERLRLSAVFAAALGAQCGWDEADSFAWLAA